MAFPVVQGSAALTQVTSSNPATISMPAGIVAGELLACAVASDTSAAISQSGGSDWTKLSDTLLPSSVARYSFWVKIAAGGDTLSLSTGGANDLAAVTFRISDHGVANVLVDIVQGAVATGTSANPDPPNSNPVVAKDYLWIEHFAADDDDNTATYWSTNYTGVGQAESAQSTSSCMSSVGRRALNATQENPGTMAMSASEEWAANTYAIPPVGTTQSQAPRSMHQYRLRRAA